MTVRKSQTYDHATLMQDAVAVTASAVGKVGGVARVLDVGLADLGHVKAVMDVTAVSGTNPTLAAVIQGATDEAMTSPVTLGRADVTGVGRSEIHFSNNQAGTLYRYVRVNFTIGGTDTPSFTPLVYLTKD